MRSARPPRQDPEMTVYVLVHGAWHGGWCWIKVARLLTDAANVVYTPTLTGLGERAHLARPEIDLETHVQDIVAVLETEELRNVVLVGHSYGGLVISGVAARADKRIARLVYLDAFVPDAGRSLLSFMPPERAEGIRKAAATDGEGWRIPPFPPERFGVTSARDTEWLARHLVPQPLRTFEQPLAAAPPAKIPRTYIYCSKPAMGTFDQFAERLRDDRKWRFHDVKTGHDAMVTAPGEIAKILMADAKD
jgi:pimeloyl-ACP methyl ester carboxylesterase